MESEPSKYDQQIQKQKDKYDFTPQDGSQFKQQQNYQREALFKYSPLTIKYKKEFFNCDKEVTENKSSFDFKAYEQRFKKYNVTYTPQRSIAMPFTLYKSRQQMRGKIKNYLAKFSYFSVQISIYNEVDDNNFDINLLYENFITSGSFGNVCSYEGDKESVPSRFIIKLLKFNHTPWQVIYSAIKEYAFMKVFAALRIGPELGSPFGFDIVTTSSYVIFSMEKGIIMDDFLHNMLGKEKKSKFLLSKLENDIKILHYFSIVHVDIKPQNIIFSPTFQKLVFIDFGLSEALRFPIGTLQLVTFSGSFTYCSQQMKKLFSEGGPGYVDLYYNDFQCWKNTRQWIQANQNNRNFCLSSEISNSISYSFNCEFSFVTSLQCKKKNKKVKTYFDKIKIIYLVHTNTKEGFHQWFIEHEAFKQIFWKDDLFFNELIQTYNLKEYVHRSPIIDTKFMTEFHMDSIQKTLSQKQQQYNSETTQDKNKQIERVLKFRYNDEYFLEKENIDQIMKNLKNQRNINKKEKEKSCIEWVKQIPVNRLKEVVLKTIINEFDFLRGIAKSTQQIDKYLLQTMKLVLNEQEIEQIEELCLKDLVSYCLNYTVREILSFLQHFSVHQIVYRFIKDEINCTQKINKFAEKLKLSSDPEIIISLGQTYDLSFFYYDLEKYIIFLINRFEAEAIFEDGYSTMDKVKLNFYSKLTSLKQIWQEIDSQFIYSPQQVKQYLSSQIIKTYVKQSLLRCSYFYCKLISEMFFFAHQKNDLERMHINLKELHNFLLKCKGDRLLEGMILEEPVFMEYNHIMKIMFTMYTIPAQSYHLINLRAKIENKIRYLTNTRQRFRKDEYRHILFILHTAYIQVLASENAFTELFVALQKCFEIVNYWRCEYLFVNVITIMAQFSNDEIIAKAQKYLQNMRKNVFSSISYQSRQTKSKLYFTNKTQKNQHLITQTYSLEKHQQQHLKQIQKLCNFEKICQISGQFITFYSQMTKHNKNKFDKMWISKYCQTLQKIQSNTFNHLKAFQEEIDTSKLGNFCIYENSNKLETALKNIKFTKELTTIEFVLFHYKFFQNDVIIGQYQRLKQLQNRHGVICKSDFLFNSQHLDILYIKVVFLDKIESQRNYEILRLIIQQKDILRKAKNNFQKAFQAQCFATKKNDMTYLQTYLKIMNEKINLYGFQATNHLCYDSINKEFHYNKKHEQLFDHYKTLQNIFIYMNGGQSQNKSNIQPIQLKKNYVSSIFTLKEEYIEMCVNLCNYSIELINQKIQAHMDILFGQQANIMPNDSSRKDHTDTQHKINQFFLIHNSKHEQQDFTHQIEKVFFLFQKLTLFTTQYSCKNYSQFIFGIASSFVFSYTKMKNTIIQSLPQHQRTNKIKDLLFGSLEKQFLSKLDYLILPGKRLLQKTIQLSNQQKAQQQKAKEGQYSNCFQQLINLKGQIKDQKQNKEILFVCFILLKITIDHNPHQALSLIKIIIANELCNLYSHSRKLIKENIQSLLIGIYQSMVCKFNENNSQSGVSLQQYSALQRKIHFYKKKVLRQSKIKELLKKRMKRNL